MIGRLVYARLKSEGHEITATWLNDHSYGNGEQTPNERGVKSLRCEHEIRKSNALIYINDGEGRGGRDVEMGIALALDLPIYLLGERLNTFHYHTSIQAFDDLEELLRCIQSSKC